MKKGQQHMSMLSRIYNLKPKLICFLAIFFIMISVSPPDWLHAADRESTAAKLNVLLIMVDDLRDYGGAFTRDVVKTPNLDRLRARGTTFERAYVQYPVCNPSRCSMMTGLRAEQTGIVGNDKRLRERLPDIVTMPQLCKESGWQSYAFGKLYHLGGGKNLEARQAWMDTGKSWHTAQAFETTTTGKKMIEGRNVTDGALNWCHWGAAAGTDDDQPDGQIAQATVAKIEELGDTPWFIGCGFMKPHDPFIAPKKYFDMYPIHSLRIWHEPDDIASVHKDAVGFGDYGKAFANFTNKEWSELFRAYCAGTSFMDAQLGRVLDALDKNRLWDKTLVIFVGDHGYHTGERNWWNKNTLFERSCRAPLVIAAPGINGGQTSRSLVEFVDLYPTVADLCDLKIPHEVAGTSLSSVLKSPDNKVKEAALTLVTRGPKLYGQSIRTARWRLTKWSDDQTQLYDHNKDPEESYNIASEHPEIVKELVKQLQIVGKPQP
jgi:iduronate 2-sulfatase